ncbi:hypothetical protein BJ684DRAFT_20305 [Piptocephalis cylindrospora]|uniref:Uncharacterized protein n=1 Tax=Piptocephalis cylindrospora TaxID=1907219 RepID=A0A4P9Y5V1_9FUNG|nr:hypothetical protein BJ684DRAFT_20305 [Piptocephalis cylindrospora]|eukprot:RKP13190.1 hypothetical protein BJ684DRAFT_20305 [Piptocephalis cylindrospora]
MSDRDGQIRQSRLDAQVLNIRCFLRIAEALACLGTRMDERSSCPMPEFIEIETAVNNMNFAVMDQDHRAVRNIISAWRNSHTHFQEWYNQIQTEGYQRHLHHAIRLRTLRNSFIQYLTQAEDEFSPLVHELRDQNIVIATLAAQYPFKKAGGNASG